MSHLLQALYEEENCHIISIDEQEGVTLKYQDKIVKIPYKKWKKIEKYTLSYFQFQLETILQQYCH